MTEKEFENLKVGDRVWIIPWFKGQHIFEGTIYDIKKINSKWVSVEENKGYTYPPEYVFKTKVEAFEGLVRKRERSVVSDRCMLQTDERELAEAKAELDKAKEEEENESGWTRILHNGKFEIAQEKKCDKDITFCHDCVGENMCKQKVEKEKAFEESGVFLGKVGEAAFVLENKLEEALFKRFEERLAPRLEKIEERLTENERKIHSVEDWHIGESTAGRNY